MDDEGAGADLLTDTPPRSVPGDGGRVIRVALFQPTLATYRVPVFKALAARPGISLKVYYGDQPDIPNGVPDGFEAELAHIAYYSRGRHALYWQQRVLAGLKEPGVDVAIFASDVHNLVLVPALMTARARGMGTVVWGHGYSKSPARWRDAIRNRLSSLASVQLLYNKRAAGEMVARGFSPSRVFTAPNSRDASMTDDAIQYWKSRPTALEAQRRELGLGPGPILLFVSRLVRANRAERLISQVSRLRGRYPAIQGVIVGSGPDEEFLRAEARRIGVEDRMIFRSGLYDERALAPFFLSADAFVYPKNAGLSILHAMAYSLPVVAGDNTAGHNPEIEALRDGESGLLYRSGDEDALEAVLARLFSDPGLRQRLGAGARRVIDTEFNLPRMVDGMEAAIRAADAQRGRSPSVAGLMCAAFGLDSVLAGLAELGSNPILTAGAGLTG